MKQLVLATVALSALSTAAFAADLPSRRAPPVYMPPPPPVFTWTGGYLGINAGYAFDGDSKFTTNDAAAPIGFPGFARTRSSGFTGGGQIGYNYQFPGGTFPIPGLGGLFGSGLVIGVEADAAYVGNGADTTTVFGGNAALFHARTDYVGTVRGRLGYALGSFLVYGTGGFAYGGVHDNVNIGALGFSGSRSSTRTGYAYGGGVEYAIPTSSFLNVFNSSAVTVKAEFIHYDLGSSTIITPGAGTSFASRIKTDGNLVRAGLNYKFDFFGSPAAPVVARY